eukprot:280712_1
MIVFLQRFYDPSANSNIRYQEIFTEFIAYQRTQPLLTFADIDAITFENCRAVVRDAVSVAFCHVLSSYEEPVNIARKKSNVSNTANTSNNRSDCDVNPSIHHPQRAPNPNEKAMAIPRAPKAKKPFIRRIRLFRSSKNKRPLHKKHKSDEIDRVQCPLQTLKQSPNNNKNTKQRSVIDAQTCSSKSKVMISSTVAITSPNTNQKRKRNKQNHSVDEYVQGLYNKGDYSAKYDEANPNYLFCSCCDDPIGVVD